VETGSRRLVSPKKRKVSIGGGRVETRQQKRAVFLWVTGFYGWFFLSRQRRGPWDYGGEPTGILSKRDIAARSRRKRKNFREKGGRNDST